jgi:hypothetical protein
MRHNRGKLLQTRYAETPNSDYPCFTCKCLDWESEAHATHVRVQTFEHLQISTHFCSEHVRGAQNAA